MDLMELGTTVAQEAVFNLLECVTPAVASRYPLCCGLHLSPETLVSVAVTTTGPHENRGDLLVGIVPTA